MPRHPNTSAPGAPNASPRHAPAPPGSAIAFGRRLYVRIYLALLVSLAVAGALSAVVAHLHADPSQIGAGIETFAELAGEVLPPADASAAAQQAALSRWSSRVHADLALYGADGRPIAAVGRSLPAPDGQTDSGWVGGHPPVFALHLPDRRWLLLRRPQMHQMMFGSLAFLALIALAVALGAYPVVRRLTRRLERLQGSVEAWGDGQLSTRVPVEGEDEVARLAASFNHSAERIETLVNAHKTLLANASHELRSPLARIRMAAELSAGAGAPALREELNRNIAELDQLIDEILLASRLDATLDAERRDEDIDLTGLAAEECARVDAELDASAVGMRGDARLIRRLIRNLLENAKRYGAQTTVQVRLSADAAGLLTLDVCDNGPGVPEAERERIFAPFYRVPGASETAGGVGLGLALVRQIARRHGGEVRCLANREGGSCFRVTLPGAA